jgi:Na+/proline symporter
VFGSLALAYTLLGGLVADVLTDTIQFVMMCVSLAVAVPILMYEVGGFANLQADLPERFFDAVGGLPVSLLLVYASTGLVVFVEPAFYQRIFAAESARAIRNALLIGIVLWAAYDWCVTAAGMLAAGAVARGMRAEVTPDLALISAVTQALPAGLPGLFVAGVLAAEMSTIDSYTLVAGGNLAYDIYRPLCRPDASDRELLSLTKLAAVFAWVLGFAIAVLFERLLALWVFTATILIATTLVPVGAALFWPGRRTPAAGFLSSALGLGSAVVFYAAIGLLGRLDEAYGTYIWQVAITGTEVQLWQEYALLVGLPLSLLGFVVGNFFGDPIEEKAP